MRKNKESIEDFDEDDMPCPCTVCGEWFDLNDGKEHPRKEGHVICAGCARDIQSEVDREEEIEDLLAQVSDAEYTLKECKDRLEKLDYKQPIHPVKSLQECKETIAKKYGKKSYYALVCLTLEPSQAIRISEELAELYASQFKTPPVQGDQDDLWEKLLADAKWGNINALKSKYTIIPNTPKP